VDASHQADLVSYFVNKSTITPELKKKKQSASIMAQGDLNPLVEGSVVLVHAMKA
jgi:hypothetical protein